MQEKENAELPRFIDRWTIEYVRVYPHPIERVWRAIIDPDEFGVWFIPGKLDAKAGGRYRFGAKDSTFSGVVVEIDPPRFVRFGDSNGADRRGYFQYELAEVAGGTRMRFVQNFPPDGVYAEAADDPGGDTPVPGTPWKPGFVGGWHEFWDALGDFLDGVPPGSRLPPTEFGALATSWARVAVLGGEFTPEEAARHVRELRRTERWNELNKFYRVFIREHCPPT